ncbi:hypothetical protein JTB14_032758 [Gonioctena quinquepunctata]|nr:hypothetical protein JTB14_032758 [Gonioctena quinquepunctata]
MKSTWDEKKGISAIRRVFLGQGRTSETTYMIFYAISSTLLNISKILLDKINVGREKKCIQEELRRRCTLFYAISRTLLNISRILLNISRILLDKIKVG